MPRLALAAALIFLAAPLAQAQSVSTTSCIPEPGSAPSSAIPALTYDVASIRQIKSSDGSLRFSDPSHEAKLSISGITMKNLISEAYGVTYFDVSGGPAWIEDEHFDIQAKSDDSVNAQLQKLNNWHVKQLMLQALLADRMKLAAHHASKVVTGYDLVLAKNGPRLQASKPAADEDAAGEAKLHGGSMSMRMSKNGEELSAQNYSMSSFASWLNIGDLHSPVQDKTGLTGTYDFKLQWSDDDSPASASSQDASWPSIFTALQEQLGLKLKPSKVSIDTIVIDHVEPPSPN
jgi:uncharacterized protein (TIGR03435 family)